MQTLSSPLAKSFIGELSKGEGFSDGFIDRILFVMPNLQQKARWSKTELPESTEGRWSSIIQQLIEIPCPKDEEGEIIPEIVPFAENAKARLYMWQEEHAKLCDTEANETLIGVYCKLEVYIIRFCLIIQIARWVCSEGDKNKLLGSPCSKDSPTMMGLYSHTQETTVPRLWDSSLIYMGLSNVLIKMLRTSK